jgi:hypothetical protein
LARDAQGQLRVWVEEKYAIKEQVEVPGNKCGLCPFLTDEQKKMISLCGNAL